MKTLLVDYTQSAYAAFDSETKQIIHVTSDIDQMFIDIKKLNDYNCVEWSPCCRELLFGQWSYLPTGRKMNV